LQAIREFGCRGEEEYSGLGLRCEWAVWQFRGILGEVLGFEVEEDGHEGEVLDLGTGEREREGESVKKRKPGYIVLENEVGKEDKKWRPQKPG
jgi:hypothetical protein